MPIGALERGCIATSERVVRWVGDRGTSLFNLGHDRIHLGSAPDIVSERELGGAAGSYRHLGFMREILASPDGELQALLQVKERDGSMLTFCPDDALRGEAQPIPIKPQRALHIIDAEGAGGVYGFMVLSPRHHTGMRKDPRCETACGGVASPAPKGAS